MSTAFALAIRGDLQALLDQELAAGKRAVTEVITRRTAYLKGLMRMTIATALGPRLARALRSGVKPDRGTSLNAKGAVYSKAGYKDRARGGIDLLQVFEEDQNIRPVKGQWLAIPTRELRSRIDKRRRLQLWQLFSEEFQQLVEAKSRRRKSKRAYENLRFAIIPNKDGKSLRVVDRANPKNVYFILVKSVRLQKKYNLSPLIQDASSGIDQEIVAAWEQNLTGSQEGG